MSTKTSIAFLALAAGLTTATPTFAEDVAEGQRLAQLAFKSLDSANRGYVDLGEFLNFGGDVLFSMDGDESNSIDLAEYLSWDYGMLPLAQDVDREDAYYTALRVVFAFWDRNGDGEITPAEHRHSLIADFNRADSDNDATLNEAEFTSDMSVMVALRAAINPVPVE